MSEKYCDHGLYGAAVVTGNTTSANATLTVTAVTSGRLGLGAMITGTNIPANTYISALVAGGGTGGAEGTGQYTMSANATATATGTTITASMGGPSLVPAWGVAQEGDGTAIGAATPATVSIDMTSWTFSTSSTLSIMGATSITCTASATTSSATAAPNAQYSATLTTMIDNLVTAINWQSANTVNIPAGWTATQVRNTVFARRNGNSLELMTRAGSAGWNTLVAATFASVTGSSSQSWSSGVGGAWGILLPTHSATWPSGVTTYGLWSLSTRPFAGVMVNGDSVFVRANKTIRLMINGHAYIYLPTIGSVTDPITFTVDTNSIWTGDGSTATLSIQHISTSSNVNFSVLPGNNSYLKIAGKKLGDEDYNLKLSTSGTNIALIVSFAQSTGQTTFENINFTSAYYARMSLDAPLNGGNRHHLINCNVKHPTATSFLIFSSTWSTTLSLTGVTFDNTGNASAHGGIISPGTGSTETVFKGLSLVGFVPGSVLCGAITGSYKLNFIDTNWGSVTSRGPYCGAATLGDYDRFVSSYSSVGKRDFSLDNGRGLVVWNSSLGQPTLGAVLPNGVDNWSFRLAPHTSAGPTLLTPLTTPKIAKINSLATGARTITLQFCLTDTLTWNKKNVSISVNYTDASGKAVVLSTLDYNAGALTQSTETWSSEAVNPANPEGDLLKATYVHGATLYHKKYKLEVSTPSGQDLPLNAEVGIYFNVHTPVTNATQFLFVDPDVSIA